jgi:hypothetical protein
VQECDSEGVADGRDGRRTPGARVTALFSERSVADGVAAVDRKNAGKMPALPCDYFSSSIKARALGCNVRESEPFLSA